MGNVTSISIFAWKWLDTLVVSMDVWNFQEMWNNPGS